MTSRHVIKKLQDLIIHRGEGEKEEGREGR
jgi:hypothetical protein